MTLENPGPQQALLDAYECLRAYVLHPQAPAAIQGLALVLRQGLAAWIRAFVKALPPPRTAPLIRPSDEAMPATLAHQVALLLAGMALKSQSEASC